MRGSCAPVRRVMITAADRNGPIGDQSDARRRPRRVHRRRRYGSAQCDASLRRRVRLPADGRRCSFCAPVLRSGPASGDRPARAVDRGERISPARRRTRLFESIGCRLVLPPREIAVRTGDKLEFATFLREIGVPGPATQRYCKEIEIDRFPVYLKPRRGSGSVGTSPHREPLLAPRGRLRPRRLNRSRGRRRQGVYRRLLRGRAWASRCGGSARADRD